MKKICLFLFLVSASIAVNAQITGTIMDDSQNPLMGVTVQAPATGAVATTDMDGNFEISVPVGTELEIAFLGFRSKHVAATQNMRIVLLRKGLQSSKAEADTHAWKVFVLANGMTSFPFSPGVGLTIGMVRKGGWYLNAMTGFGFHFTHQGTRSNTDNQLFYTGKKSDQLLSVSLGAVARLGRAPVYWYGGAGYAYKSLTYETNTGDWIALHCWEGHEADWSPMHSICAETGLMANIKGFAVSAGYELLIDVMDAEYFAHELKIGIGGMFNCKRRTNK